MSIVGSLSRLVTVKDIATPTDALIHAESEAEARELMEEHRIDVVTRRPTPLLTSYWHREGDGEHQISRDDVVGPSLSVAAAAARLAQRNFMFVVEGAGVSAYVHASDLNRPAVKVVLYSLFEEVERVMFEHVLPSLDVEDLRGSLSARRRTAFDESLAALQRKNLDHDWSGLLYLREVLALATKRMPAVEPVQRERLNTFRNRVAHADRSLVQEPEDVAEVAAVFAELDRLGKHFRRP